MATAVRVLSGAGPAWLIPDLVPMAISPADDVANSRIEINDPYVALLFPAGLTALPLTVVSIATRRRSPVPGRVTHRGLNAGSLGCG